MKCDPEPNALENSHVMQDIIKQFPKYFSRSYKKHDGKFDGKFDAGESHPSCRAQGFIFTLVILYLVNAQFHLMRSQRRLMND